MFNRRDFLRALAAGTGAILVPQFGRWHRHSSGLLTPPPLAEGMWASPNLEGDWHIALYNAGWKEVSGGNYARQKANKQSVVVDGSNLKIDVNSTWVGANGFEPIWGAKIIAPNDVIIAESPLDGVTPNGGDLTVNWPMAVTHW